MSDNEKPKRVTAHMTVTDTTDHEPKTGQITEVTDNEQGGVSTYSAKSLRDKQRNDPERERLAKALERGMCE